jgi:predicted RNA-binding Zn ribbon-like protein
VHDEPGRLRAGWLVDDPRHAVLAAAAVTLRAQLSGHPGQRLGTCTGRRCADVYVDTSPGGRRRFCSIPCQNRARVAAFRSRRAGA